MVLWSSPVGQVAEWREGHVSLSVTLFKVQVEAVFGVQDNTSFVAFDDFSLHVGTCGGSGQLLLNYAWEFESVTFLLFFYHCL